MGGLPENGVLGQFTDLMGGLAKKTEGAFEGWLIPTLCKQIAKENKFLNKS